MLKQVLLGNKDPYYGDEEYSRARLSSASGRPVLQKGVGLVFGEETSSESEEEEEEEEEEEPNQQGNGQSEGHTRSYQGTLSGSA